MTMNDTWGYKSDDKNRKSTETLIRNLCDIASKGGNFLLNVGPMSDGEIPQPSLDRLAQVGQWMKVNSAAIYRASPTPFGGELGQAVKDTSVLGAKILVSSQNDWRCTTKSGKLYVMIFNWPATAELELPGLQSKVTKATLLATGKTIEFNQSATGVTLTLPNAAPDKIASVIRVETADAVAKVAPLDTAAHDVSEK